MSVAGRVDRWVLTGAMLLLGAASVAYALSVDSQGFLETGISQHVSDWLAGRPLYGDLAVAPHNLAVYGPLYYALIAPFAALSRASGVLVGIRVVCLLSIVASLGAARSISRALTDETTTRAAAFIVPLGLSFGILWPESGATWPASALELCGLAVLCQQVKRAGGKTWPAYLIFLLAVLVKQNAIGIAAGTLLARFVADRTDRVRALRDGVLFVVAVAAAQFVVNVATHGAYGRAVYLTAVADPKSVWSAFTVTRGVLAPGAIAIALAFAGQVGNLRARRLCWSAAVVAGGIALVGVSKAGAGPAYFLPTILCICSLAAASLATLDRRAMLVVSAGLALSLWPSRDMLSTWKQELAARHPYDAEAELVRRLPAGPILSELPIIARLAGRDAWVTDPYLYSLGVERGLISNGLVSDLVTCRVAAVLLFRQGFPAKPAFLLRHDGAPRTAFLAALDKHYREERGTVDFRLFLPACGPVTQRSVPTPAEEWGGRGAWRPRRGLSFLAGQHEDVVQANRSLPHPPLVAQRGASRGPV